MGCKKLKSLGPVISQFSAPEHLLNFFNLTDRDVAAESGAQHPGFFVVTAPPPPITCLTFASHSAIVCI